MSAATTISAGGEMIRGTTRGGVQVDVPRYSPIVANFWVGGTPNTILPIRFKYAVNLCPKGQQYALTGGQVMVAAQLYDGAKVPDEKLLKRLAEFAWDFNADGSTLIHCHEGLNRAPLLLAFTLMRYHRWTAEQAIKLMREQRHAQVLHNEAFEKWLLGYGRSVDVAEPNSMGG